MGKKNRSRKQADPETAAAFAINPFADLNASNLELAKSDAAAKPGVAKAKARAPDECEGVNEEDRKLLAALGDAKLDFAASAPIKGTVSLQVQRKGRGGKTVTRVLGLKDLSMTAEMDLINRLKKGLGTGAHFREGVVELQGDLRRRAAAWFAENNYRVKP